MVTVVNTPPGTNQSEGSGVGLIVGIILAIVVIALFFIYGLPALRSTQNVPESNNKDINIDVDLPNTPAPSGGQQTPGTGGSGTPESQAQ